MTALFALVAALMSPPARPVPAALRCPPDVTESRRPAAACVDPDHDRIWTPRIEWPTEIERTPPPAVDAAVAALAALLDATPAIEQLRIEGHLETHHAFRMYSRKVCRNRAATLAERLIRAGIDRARLVVVGYGDDRPIHDPRTPEGRLANRRFEFYVTRWRAPTPDPAAPDAAPPPAP